VKKNTANTDSLTDWLYNPNLVGPSVGVKKPGKVANAIAFVIVFLLVTGIGVLWFGLFAVLIHAVFAIGIGKSVAAAALFHLVVYVMAVFRNTK
jgi:hypothetical protein